MRPIRPTALAVVIALAAAFGAAQAPAAMADTARITVTGEGRVESRPDMAVVTLGVTTEAATAAEALRENSARLGAVLERLRAAGIEPRDLQTTGLNVSPQMDYGQNNRRPRITGYQASNMLTIRVRDLSTLGGLLDTAVADGANTLHGLSFGLAGAGAAADAARVAAVRDARRKAEMMAEAAGVRLGPIIEMTEHGGGPDPRPMMMRAASADVMESVPVAEGEIGHSVNVAVVWALVQD